MTRLHSAHFNIHYNLQDAYGIFVKYLQDALHIDAATKQAWDRIIVVICHITEAYKKEVSA